MQVYLVTGGQTLGRFYEVLDSTELLVAGAATWLTAGTLPSHRFGLRGVTLNNKIIMTGQPSSIPGDCLQSIQPFVGGRFSSSSWAATEDVLMFDAGTAQWRRVGAMEERRGFHALSRVNYNAIKHHCV